MEKLKCKKCGKEISIKKGNLQLKSILPFCSECLNDMSYGSPFNFVGFDFGPLHSDQDNLDKILINKIEKHLEDSLIKSIKSMAHGPLSFATTSQHVQEIEKPVLMDELEIKEAVEYLIENELRDANKKFSQFNSRHEGFAVINEEVQEAIDEVNKMIHSMNDTWTGIKNDIDIDSLMLTIENLEKSAKNGIKELIQVAAMCKKFKNLKKKDD